MIQTAIQIPERNWQPWLQAATAMTNIQALEVDIALLDDQHPGAGALDRCGLPPVHITNLLPVSLTRYLPETEAGVRAELVRHAEAMLQRCGSKSGRYVSINAGLERVRSSNFAHDLQQRIDILRPIAAAAENAHLCLAFPLRLPTESPHCQSWAIAANLIHELMHSNCRLTLNVFNSELEPEFDIAEFIRPISFTLGVVRFHYEPALGQCLDLKVLQSWADVLAHYCFTGVVVFCPQQSSYLVSPARHAEIDAGAMVFADA